MRFSYASPARLADIPCLDAASLRAAILTQVAHGWRVLAFFGLPRALYAQGRQVCQERWEELEHYLNS